MSQHFIYFSLGADRTLPAFHSTFGIREIERYLNAEIMLIISLNKDTSKSQSSDASKTLANALYRRFIICSMSFPTNAPRMRPECL